MKSEKMLLAIDIGNTSIHNGIFKGKFIKKTFRVPTYATNLNAQYTKGLRPYLKEIQFVIIVSVVPTVLKKVEHLLKEKLNKKILVVGRDIDSNVKNLYKNPKEVGQDRLVNAKAAYELYKGESIVVDFGTAITIDIINRRKEYLGGVIAPGVEISVRALSERAYLLPEVKIRKPKGILGKETRESMISGAIYGFSGLCDGIVQKLKKRYSPHSQVIATGGLARLIGPYCKSVDKIDPELTLKGLQLIGAERDV